jgi:DNA-binding transcriptional ArsR family regulator
MHQLSFDLNGILNNSKKAATVLRALNNDFRKRILLRLLDSPKSTVTQLYNHLRMEQSVASQHLAILRRAGIVNAERDGKFIYYSVNIETLSKINEHSILLIYCMPKQQPESSKVLRQTA